MRWRRPNGVSSKTVRDNLASDINKYLWGRQNKGKRGIEHNITKQCFINWITESAQKRKYVDKKMLSDSEFYTFIEKEYDNIIIDRIRKCASNSNGQNVNPYYFPLLVYQLGYGDYIIANRVEQAESWRDKREDMLSRQVEYTKQRCIDCIEEIKRLTDETSGVKKLHGN